MKEKIIENFNRLAGAYEKTVDTHNLYNAEYERPAMLSEIAETLEGKAFWMQDAQRVGTRRN